MGELQDLTDSGPAAVALGLHQGRLHQEIPGPAGRVEGFELRKIPVHRAIVRGGIPVSASADIGSAFRAVDSHGLLPDLEDGEA
jgi:hypothetical protein